MAAAGLPRWPPARVLTPLKCFFTPLGSSSWREYVHKNNVTPVTLCGQHPEGGSMAATNSAIEPVTRLELDGYDWYERHAQILQYQAAVDPQIVLIGDSITHFFGALAPQPMPRPAVSSHAIHRCP